MQGQGSRARGLRRGGHRSPAPITPQCTEQVTAPQPGNPAHPRRTTPGQAVYLRYSGLQGESGVLQSQGALSQTSPDQPWALGLQTAHEVSVMGMPTRLQLCALGLLQACSPSQAGLAPPAPHAPVQAGWRGLCSTGCLKTRAINSKILNIPSLSCLMWEPVASLGFWELEHVG